MNKPQDDSTKTLRLLSDAACGITAARDELFALYRPMMRSVVDLRLDNRLRKRVDPSDIVQDTLTEVSQRLTDFLDRRPMPFRLWLRKSTYERLIKVREQHVAAQRRSVEREISLPDRSSIALAQLLVGERESPSRQFLKKEAAQQVREALYEIGETDREVLLMRYVEGLSNAQIGSILDMNPAAVSKRHGRALLKLQSILEAKGFET